MKELNPNHPVTQSVHDHWHKLCAVLVCRFGGKAGAITITEPDIRALERAIGPDGAVVADTRGGGLVLRLVDGEEAARLVRQEGGQ